MQFRIVLLVLLVGVPAWSQDPDSKRSKREEILAAIDLPASAQALRKKGVDKAEVKEALRAAKGKKVKAKDAKALLDESSKAVDENGKIDNFGAFVKSKLGEGLRGRDLAAAIHAEHKKRGKGKGKGKDKANDKGKGKSKEQQKGKEKDGDKGKGKGKGAGSEEELEKEPKPESCKEEKADKEKGGGSGKGKGKGKQK